MVTVTIACSHRQWSYSFSVGALPLSRPHSLQDLFWLWSRRLRHQEVECQPLSLLWKLKAFPHAHLFAQAASLTATFCLGSLHFPSFSSLWLWEESNCRRNHLCYQSWFLTNAVIALEACNPSERSRLRVKESQAVQSAIVSQAHSSEYALPIVCIFWLVLRLHSYRCSRACRWFRLQVKK